MSNKKLGILFFITGLAVSVGLALSAAVVGSFYENKNQELYNSCIETSASILIKDGNTSSRDILPTAKEACEGYKKGSESPAIILSCISILSFGLVCFYTYKIYKNK